MLIKSRYFTWPYRVLLHKTSHTSCVLSSGFCVSIAERAHLLFLRGKIVCGITTTLSPDPMKHWGDGRLRRVLLRGSTVTGSSLAVLLEEASPAFVLDACSHGLSLMVTNLSLAFSENMPEQTVGWPSSTMGRRSFRWRGIPSTVMFCPLVIPVARPTLYFVVHRPCGAFTHTRSPGLKTACCWLCVGADVLLIPFSRMRYW